MALPGVYGLPGEWLMVSLSLFSTVEFYVIFSVVAACIVAFMALPSKRGEARQLFVRGDLRETLPEAPSVELRCTDRGDVVVIRRGLDDMSVTGEVNLAIEIVGFDVRINERIVRGSGPGESVEAMFVLDFFGRERYHVTYASGQGEGFAAMSFHARPGMVVTKLL